MRERARRVGALLAAAGLLAGAAGSLSAVVASSPVGAAGPIVFDGSPGTSAPPATLGPYTMTPFPADARPFNTDVTDVPAPTGGSVGFSIPLSHRGVPNNGWSNWSNGYTGDVYCSDCGSNPNPNTVTMTLPTDTLAFYFYAQTDEFGPFNITATAQDGTTSGPISVDNEEPCLPNECAKYFGFYTTDSSNPLVSITVSVPASTEGPGLGIGEFGISNTTPTPPPSPVIVVTPKFTG